MSSKVAICNGAAIHLGRDPTFSDPARIASASPMGQAFAASWDLVMPAVVAAYPWNFATRRYKAPKLEATPAFGWLSQYERPSDLLKVRDVNFTPGVKPVPYDLEAGAILVNLTDDTVNLRYIARILDPAKFDPQTVLYATYALAAFNAVKVTGSQALQQTLKEEGDKLLAANRTSDAQEIEEEPDDQNGDWLDQRASVT